MSPHKIERRLKVAIIGGGPGGLGAAIELGKLPFVDWDLYEKRSRFYEIGGGFTLQPQTWRLLEINGAANNIKETDFFRSPEGFVEQRRNGRTGELLIEKFHPEDIPPNRRSCRLARTKLQNALLKQVDQTHVHLSKRLVAIDSLPNNRVRISFEDGSINEVDLLVAADGIRSVIRKSKFPSHTLQYNGQSVYRTIISKIKASKINGIPWAPIFWKHTSGLYVYTCPLGDDDFEVTARIRRPACKEDPVCWGQPVDLHTLLEEYKDFCLPVQQVLQLAAEGNNTQEFALFSGPPLERMVSQGNIAFIGDAAHALLGNFGSGAGFALEDVYALTATLDWAWSWPSWPSPPRQRSLSDALDLYDSIRSPHYARLHDAVDRFARIKADVRQQYDGLSLDEEIAERVRRISLASESWMYYYDIEKVVLEAICDADKNFTEQRMSRKFVEDAKSDLFVDEREAVIDGVADDR